MVSAEAAATKRPAHPRDRTSERRSVGTSVREEQHLHRKREWRVPAPDEYAGRLSRSAERKSSGEDRGVRGICVGIVQLVEMLPEELALRSERRAQHPGGEDTSAACSREEP